MPPLTGVRAVAAALVYLHHYPQTLPTWAAPYCREGYVGVSIFFVLSGLLITHRYYDDTHGLGFYLRARAARIYPVYLLLVVLTLVVKHRTDWQGIALNLTLAKGLVEHYKFDLIPQTWSLTVEECFYLSAPILFWCARRYVLWTPWLVIPWLGMHLIHPYGFMLRYTFPGRINEFMAGMCLCLVLRRWHPPKCGLTWIGLAGVIGMVAYGSCLPTVAMFTPQGWWWQTWGLPVATATWFAGLMREPTWLAALLGSRPAVWLGKASYIFYLIHVGVVQQWLARHGYAMPWALIGVSLAGYALIEAPCQWALRGR